MNISGKILSITIKTSDKDQSLANDFIVFQYSKFFSSIYFLRLLNTIKKSFSGVYFLTINSNWTSVVDNIFVTIPAVIPIVVSTENISGLGSLIAIVPLRFVKLFILSTSKVANQEEILNHSNLTIGVV